MKIVIIHKNALQNIPPLLSTACILADLGHQVHIITCGVNESISKILETRNITFEVYPYFEGPGKIRKVFQYLQFRYAVKNALLKLAFDYIWIEDAHTFLSICSLVEKKYKYILQISELYDEVGYLQKSIRNIIKGAKLIFMPEYNRSVLYQVWYHLDKRPVLLSNKPYFVPNKIEIEQLKFKYKHLFDIIGDKKVILYQGYISRERNISAFIDAAGKMGDNYIFVLMGKNRNGIVEEYKALNPNLVYFDFIPAPDYLAITSIAYIGILSYDPMHLNTAYCAPNKIYEYGAFGVPMVGNNIPGLKVIEQEGAGILTEREDVGTILQVYKRIENNHSEYANNALKLYQKTDNFEVLKNSLSTLDVINCK